MIWLIQQLFWPLVIAFTFAAAAGWGLNAWRSARRESELEDERERVLRDIVRLAADNDDTDDADRRAREVELDALRRRSDLVVAKVTELERALDNARTDAEHASGRADRAEKALESAGVDAEELRRLRGEVEEHRARAAAMIEVEPDPAEEDAANQQAWRLRYFEQRVKYLEGLAQAPAALAAPVEEEDAVAPIELKRLEWRARTAEARARHLEEAARLTQARLAQPAQPNAEDDVSRWRLRYLERRAAYLAAEKIAQTPAPEPTPDPEAERLKWRTRFLEARVRFLDRKLEEAEARPPPAVAQAPLAAPIEVAEIEEEAEAPAPRITTATGRRPPSLPAARDGAPDDLTLIEGVSPMQQSTLNSLGVYHFDQIAAWSPEHVAWVDQYLRLRGRIADEEWVEQADRLAREGPLVFKRAFEAEPA